MTDRDVWINIEVDPRLISFENEKSYKIKIANNESFWLSKKMVKEKKGILYIGVPEAWTIKTFEFIGGKDHLIGELPAREVLQKCEACSKQLLDKSEKVESIKLDQTSADTIDFEDDDIPF